VPEEISNIGAFDQILYILCKTDHVFRYFLVSGSRLIGKIGDDKVSFRPIALQRKRPWRAASTNWKPRSRHFVELYATYMQPNIDIMVVFGSNVILAFPGPNDSARSLLDRHFGFSGTCVRQIK
jgi:hypothetical protein